MVVYSFAIASLLSCLLPSQNGFALRSASTSHDVAPT